MQKLWQEVPCQTGFAAPVGFTVTDHLQSAVCRVVYLSLRLMKTSGNVLARTGLRFRSCNVSFMGAADGCFCSVA